LASLTSALLVSFRNSAEARVSAERMKTLYGRLRIGLLLVVLGLLISITNTAFAAGRVEAERDLVRIAIFPIYYVGVILIAASTWYPAPKARNRLEMEGGGVPSR
jgi:hypothetical protein